ncbi:hypothetical protein AGABI1DRAFT_95827 [Agaricus bisporus var. burnettii JB137-S8]|uniref:Uncharacterized protein n=1 Tax=Agaricus bisporus var. burnettii (strain JB137-S8 / ATCC MYA-4627 / FGSC 10392) TaxID=597362 RepID=K5XIA8_AGABU|nr:uncharacterized protein AGABI1DRAFT_95827 [Agaricus bisporus var. burnettii JB137-S8]EKM74170.1 hypothetical protein AGABI1DRAFT_95827 [Agaricus bisporus var. burnettii JB137-S8]
MVTNDVTFHEENVRNILKQIEEYKEEITAVEDAQAGQKKAPNKNSNVKAVKGLLKSARGRLLNARKLLQKAQDTASMSISTLAEVPISAGLASSVPGTASLPVTEVPATTEPSDPLAVTTATHTSEVPAHSVSTLSIMVQSTVSASPVTGEHSMATIGPAPRSTTPSTSEQPGAVSPAPNFEMRLVNDDDNMELLQDSSAEDVVPDERPSEKKRRLLKKNYTYQEVTSDDEPQPGLFGSDDERNSINGSTNQKDNKRRLEIEDDSNKPKKKAKSSETKETIIDKSDDNLNDDSDDDSVEIIVSEYQPSAHEIKKATRAAQLETKRRKKSDPLEHMSLARLWLKAETARARPKIPMSMREVIRGVEDYLPDITLADYDLTLTILSNNRGNFLCMHHTKQSRAVNPSKINNLQGPTKIWGIRAFRKQNSKLTNRVVRQNETLHCGCIEKVALASFLMWKTWKAKAIIEGQEVEEGLGKSFTPRQVLFLLQFLKRTFNYTVEDMFTGAVDSAGQRHGEAELMRRTANFCAYRYRELTGGNLSLDENYTPLAEEGEAQWY